MRTSLGGRHFACIWFSPQSCRIAENVSEGEKVVRKCTSAFLHAMLTSQLCDTELHAPHAQRQRVGGATARILLLVIYMRIPPSI